jgi:hypothetical protein
MTEDHGYFQVLCALAASGQLTQTEAAELREHASDCEACSSRSTELNVLGAQLLIAHTWKDHGARLPQGMKERFVTRALREGVPLSHRTRHGNRTMDTEHLAFVAIVVLALSIFVVAHKPAARRSTVDAARAGGSPISLSTQAAIREPRETLSNLRANSARVNNVSAATGRGGLHARRGSGFDRRAQLAERKAPWSNAPPPANARASQYPHFVFTGYLQNGSISALMPPAIVLRAPLRPGGNLLAECASCAFRLSSLPAGRTFVPPPGQTPDAMLTFGVYKPAPYFKLDSAAFQLVKSVGQ